MKNNQELVGKHVELIYMEDPQAPKPGTKGIITKVDGIGQIHVNWNNGSKLALIPGEDEYKILEQ
jgi:hypothetical protein